MLIAFSRRGGAVSVWDTISGDVEYFFRGDEGATGTTSFTESSPVGRTVSIGIEGAIDARSPPDAPTVPSGFPAGWMDMTESVALPSAQHYAAVSGTIPTLGTQPFFFSTFVQMYSALSASNELHLLAVLHSSGARAFTFFWIGPSHAATGPRFAVHVHNSTPTQYSVVTGAPTTGPLDAAVNTIHHVAIERGTDNYLRIWLNGDFRAKTDLTGVSIRAGASLEIQGHNTTLAPAFSAKSAQSWMKDTILIVGQQVYGSDADITVPTAPWDER